LFDQVFALQNFPWSVDGTQGNPCG
jgi:hypothetical protein